MNSSFILTIDQSWQDNYCKRFHCDPSGTLVKTKLKAIGGGQEGAQSKLEDDFEEEYKQVSIKE